MLRYAELRRVADIVEGVPTVDVLFVGVAENGTPLYAQLSNIQVPDLASEVEDWITDNAITWQIAADFT